MMSEELLPIGTIVKVEGNTNHFMIAGYDLKGNPDSDKIYDYSAFIHPMGFSGKLEVCWFDNDKIEEIIAYGYRDKEQINFMNRYMADRAAKK